MKKRLKWMLPALLLAAIAVTAGYFLLRPAAKGPLTEFTCSYGHPWSGMYLYSLTVEDGVPRVAYTYTPMGFNEDQPARSRAAVLSREQLSELETLILRTQRIPSWPDKTGPSPDEITDQDFWSVSIVCGGERYEKSGYAEFPSGLRAVTDLFDSFLNL